MRRVTSTITLPISLSGGTSGGGGGAPVITSSNSASGSVGNSFSYQITATNSPTSYNASNVPSGTSVNTSTGLVSGTLTTVQSITMVVSATNASGTGNQNVSVTITAFTLVPIDGGATYYATNSFTKATAFPTTFNGVSYTNGWDDPKFIPIGAWLENIANQADANRWLDLGLNTMFGCNSGVDLPTLNSNGISLIQLTGQLGAGEFGGIISGSNPETVGMMSCDEPQNWTEMTGGLGTIASQTITADITNTLMNVTALGTGNTLVRNVGISGTGIVTGCAISGGFGTGQGGTGSYGVGNFLLIPSSSLTIGSPPYLTANFTVSPVDSHPFVGQTARISDAATGTKRILGTINAYNSGTGVMSVNATSVAGSGTDTSWVINFDVPSETITVAAIPGNVNAFQDHRFWWVNMTNGFIDQAPGTVSFTPSPNTVVSSISATINTPSGTTPWDKRHIDLVSIDAYLMSAGTNFLVGLAHANIYGIENISGGVSSSFTLPLTPGSTINFTVTNMNVGWVAGGRFALDASGGALASVIFGTITTINLGTGAVAATVDSTNGTGTFTSWLFLYALSAQQMNRACHYGDQVDAMRSLQTVAVGGFPAPSTVFLENGDPFTNSATDAGNRLVTSAELNAMVWAIFIHGGRFLPWFNNDSTGSPSGGSGDNFANAFYQNGGGGMASDTISMYDRAKATHACIATTAPIINAQFCTNFITGISSTGGAGFILPLTSGLLTTQNGFSKINGDLSGTPGSGNGKFEAMSKYYQGSTSDHQRCDADHEQAVDFCRLSRSRVRYKHRSDVHCCQ